MEHLDRVPHWGRVALSTLVGTVVSVALGLLLLQFTFSGISGRIVGVLILCPLIGASVAATVEPCLSRCWGLIIAILYTVVIKAVYLIAPLDAYSLITVGVQVARGPIEWLIGRLLMVSFLAPHRGGPLLAILSLLVVPALLSMIAAVAGVSLGRLTQRSKTHLRVVSAGYVALALSVTVVPALVYAWQAMEFPIHRGDDMSKVLDRCLVRVPQGTVWQSAPLWPDPSMPFADGNQRMPPPVRRGIKMTAKWSLPTGTCELQTTLFGTPLHGAVGGEIGEAKLTYSRASGGPVRDTDLIPVLQEAGVVRPEAFQKANGEYGAPKDEMVSANTYHLQVRESGFVLARYFD